MNQLSFRVGALILAALMVPLQPTRLVFAAVLGVFIFAWGYLWGEEDMLDVRLGYFAIGLGVTGTIAAFYMAQAYGVTVGELATTYLYSVGSMVPFYALVFATLGACIVAAWHVRRWRRSPPDHDHF